MGRTQEREAESGTISGRIIRQHRGGYSVLVDGVELVAEVSGKIRHEASGAVDFPAVGDFVVLDRASNVEGNAMILSLLPRTSLFVRKAAGTSGEAQAVAANIDTVFICMALTRDFNLRRLERYLSAAWQSGATPVIVLTKSDLCDDLPARLEAVHSVAVGAVVYATSAHECKGVSFLHPYLGEGQTVAFIGSSGVGKSTLINLLLGEERLATGSIDEQGKGRHTTTRRELILLPQGGAVIDTPGMRELGLESADLSKTFEDIEALAQTCRFADCTHSKEPGCAVLGAVESGELESDRLNNYRKLDKELGYEGMNARQREQQKISNMFGGMGEMKKMLRHVKEKDKKRRG